MTDRYKVDDQCDTKWSAEAEKELEPINVIKGMVSMPQNVVEIIDDIDLNDLDMVIDDTMSPNSKRLLIDFVAKGTRFEAVRFYSRNEDVDDVQVQFVLRDNFMTDFLCYLTINGIKIEKIEDDAKFEESMRQNEFVKIDEHAMQIENIHLQSAAFCTFVEEKERNFRVGSSVEFVFGFISRLLSVTRWESCDGLKWFMKGMIGIAEKDQMDDIVNDALEEVDQEKSTKVRYSYEPDPSFNSSKKQFKISKDIIATVNVNNLPVNDFLNYSRKTIVVQSQQCQWMKLANGQKIKIINCDLRQSMLYVIKEEFIRPNPQNGVEISPFYRSELVDVGLTASILAKYGISSHAVPSSFRQDHSFRIQLQQKERIRSFIVDAAFKMKQIVKKTKWNKVPIKNYEHKKQRMEYIVKKQVFVEDLNALNDYLNPTLIPIVMFDKEAIKHR